MAFLQNFTIIVGCWSSSPTYSMFISKSGWESASMHCLDSTLGIFVVGKSISWSSTMSIIYCWRIFTLQCSSFSMESEESNSLLHPHSWFSRFLYWLVFPMVVFTEVLMTICCWSSCLKLLKDAVAWMTSGYCVMLKVLSVLSLNPSINLIKNILGIL